MLVSPSLRQQWLRREIERQERERRWGSACPTRRQEGRQESRSACKGQGNVAACHRRCFSLSFLQESRDKYHFSPSLLSSLLRNFPHPPPSSFSLPSSKGNSYGRTSKVEREGEERDRLIWKKGGEREEERREGTHELPAKCTYGDGGVRSRPRAEGMSGGFATTGTGTGLHYADRERERRM